MTDQEINLLGTKKMKIIITGITGTLGSEFARQLKGNHIVGVDNCEWAVAQFEKFKGLDLRLGDYSDLKEECDLLIHCAAYKHVNLCELNREATIENNVRKLFKLYGRVKAKQILFISTDKAVEPCSIYGESKQFGENITREYEGVIVRLGNIIASTGSVIPLWEKCIEEGSPLPITDPEMTRYMITVEKAVKSILALLPEAKSGQVIIPEMGKPKKLMSIVSSVLKRHDLDLNNYPTKIIGLREGEKLHEKLFWDTERVVINNKYGSIYE